MKYLITAACGHRQEYHLYGGYNDRERKLAWLKSQACPRCRAADEARQATATALTAHEAEIEALAKKILAALLDDANPAQTVRYLRHQLAEGLGTDIRREAVRRALSRWEAQPEEGA